MFNLLGWLIFGLIAGAIARFLTPGSDPMGCIGTIVVGVLGSIIGGFLWNLATGEDWREFQPLNLIGSVIGGVLLLLVFRKLAGPRQPV